MYQFKLEKSKILVVDDVEVNTMILKKILQNEGYEIITANEGESAVSIAVSENPDLILLDIIMPDMDGITICKILKEKAETKDIPVIFISGKRETDDIVEGFKVGGVDYIQKPFYPKELLARVNTHLTLRRAIIEIEQSEKKWKKVADERDIFSELFTQSKHGVIITDLDGVITHVNTTLIELFDYSRDFLIGKKTSVLQTTKSDISVYEKLWKDITNPNIGFWTGELTNKKGNGEEITILLTIDTLKNKEGELIGYSGTYIDIVELNKLKEMQYELEKRKIYETKLRQIIIGLCAASEYSDETTGAHVIRVNEYSKFIAEKMNFEEKYVQAIGMVAALHDIGKVAIQSLIQYPGKYIPEQRLEMQKHTVYGANIITKFADENEYEFKMAKEIALNHHQSYDGDGYPQIEIGNEVRLPKGEEIPFCALIVSLADSYDALRSKRPYKKALSHEEVCQILSVDDRTGKKGSDRFGEKLWNFFLEHHLEFDKIYQKYEEVLIDIIKN